MKLNLTEISDKKYVIRNSDFTYPLEFFKIRVKMSVITCPWCHPTPLQVSILHDKLHINCKNCGMGGYIVKLPDDNSILDIMKKYL